MRIEELVQIVGPIYLEELRDFVQFKHRGSSKLPLIINLLALFDEHGKLPEPKVVSKQVFAGPHNAQRLRYLLAEAVVTAEDYLAYREATTVREQRDLLVVRASKGHATGFDKALAKAQKALGAGSLTSELRLTNYQLKWEELDHKSRLGTRNAQAADAVLGSLDLFYQTKQLQLACEQMNAARVFSRSEAKPDPKPKSLKKPRPDVLVQAYQLAMRTMSDLDSNTAAIALRTHLNTACKGVDARELRDLYQYVLNHSIRQINAGHTEHQRELYLTYQSLIEARVLDMNGELSPWDLKNLVTVSIRVGEAAYADEVLERFQHLLPKTRRQNGYNFNKAHILYAQGQHRKALVLLRDVDPDDPFYKLDARAILLKVYVAMDDRDAAFHHINAFNVFLKREKLVSDTQKKTYGNMLRFVRAYLTWDHEPKKIVQLRAKLATTENVADKAWLERVFLEA